MSSFAGYCEYCRKPVMHKTLFGTMHLCLPEEERLLLDRQKYVMNMQMASKSLIRLAKVNQNIGKAARLEKK